MFETDRLIIRKFNEKDWKDISEFLMDENVVHFEPYGVFSLEQCKEEAVNFTKSDSFWAVVLKEENKVIGKLYFDNKNSFDTWELGYTFNTSYQGKGYAKESSIAIMDYAFRNWKVRRIIARADVLNEKSWRLLEKLGMRKEAHFVKEAAFNTDTDGNLIWQDSYGYAILEEEWMNRQSR